MSSTSNAGRRRRAIRLGCLVALAALLSGTPVASVAERGEWLPNDKLTAADGALLDSFGRSVAVSGDTAIVGAVGVDAGGVSNRGAAYVFVHSGDGWAEQAKLLAGDADNAAALGVSVAIEGDTAVVGAWSANIGGNLSQGAAYVFTRSGAIWTEQAKLVASDGGMGDRFGNAVAIEGDTILVAALSATVAGNTSQGAVYVFTRAGMAWSERTKLTASDGLAGENFGSDVALSGDTALIGARYADVAGHVGTSEGAAYVFVGADAAWSEHAKLSASEPAEFAYFGERVALDGDTAVIGAFGAPVNGQASQGAAYVFVREAGQWSEQERLAAGDGVQFDQFGTAVAVTGDAAAVGAAFADIDGRINQGAVYVFSRNGTVWSEQDKLVADDGIADDNFGLAAAMRGDTLLVGAENADVDGVPNQGAVYAYALMDVIFANGFENESPEF